MKIKRDKGLNLISLAFLLNATAFFYGSLMGFWFNFYINGPLTLICYNLLIKEIRLNEMKPRGLEL